ncbi:hypothetical protein Ddye_014831 [Dipteronia dyeriana]|uniref:Uncharacterized protein n=1 Tax=Dipteronia dyeriana TaxID=168575 RepID=A0AAD9WYR4_9ROSI|nr:hypothetical protein Ddye_014831 [Dipteronia dyeriana]
MPNTVKKKLKSVLTEQGSSVSVVDLARTKGHNALGVTAQVGNPYAVRILMARDKSLAEKKFFGSLLLIEAVKFSRIEVVLYSVEYPSEAPELLKDSDDKDILSLLTLLIDYDNFAMIAPPPIDHVAGGLNGYRWGFVDGWEWFGCCWSFCRWKREVIHASFTETYSLFEVYNSFEETRMDQWGLGFVFSNVEMEMAVEDWKYALVLKFLSSRPSIDVLRVQIIKS